MDILGASPSPTLGFCLESYNELALPSLRGLSFVLPLAPARQKVVHCLIGESGRAGEMEKCAGLFLLL